jgi:hypothetical protein
MKIKMIKTEKGSEDGIHVNEYVIGKEYEICESLAKVFIKMKVAEKVKEENIIQNILPPKLGNIKKKDKPLQPPKNKVNLVPNKKGKKKK